MAPRYDPQHSGHALQQASQPWQFAVARTLFEEYAAGLGIDLTFQDFAAELDRLPAMYGPPSGCLLLIMRDQWAAGCGGVRRLSDGVCELKRLYIRKEARGAQLGRRMAVALIDRARALAYHTLRLDTLTDMLPARTLYASLGFREIAPYYATPLAGSVYMELALDGPARDPSP